MTNIVSDSLTGTAGANISTYNANWVKLTGVTGDFTLDATTGVGARNISGNTAGQYRNDASPPSADYSVQATVVVDATGTAVGANGVIGRASVSANTFYTARFNAGSTQIFKFIAGSATQLGSSASNPAGPAGPMLLKLEMIGTAIKAYVAGSGSAAISTTDSAITAAGKPGIRGTSVTSNALIGSFSADTIGGGTTVTVDGISPAEWLVQQQADSVVPTEYLVSKLADAAGCTEWSAAVRADAASTVEFTASLRIDGPAPSEWSGQVLIAADARAPIEWLAQLSGDARVPLDYIAAQRLDATVAADFMLQRTVDAVAPVQLLAGVQVDGVARADWTGGILVTANSVMPIEFGASVRTDGQVSANWSAAVLLDQRIPAEFNMGLVANQQAALEWLRSIFGDAVLPGETLAVIARNGTVPADFDGASTFVPGNLEIFTVDQRGFIWRVETRGTVWVAAARGKVWFTEPR